jgi:hypothetical protein
MRPLAALAVLLTPLPARAQPAAEPPVIGRPAYFSHVVGSYRIEAGAAPTDVAVGEPITLRVRIVGKGPPQYAPRRDKLDLFPPGWDADFFTEPAPEDDRARPADGVWEFVWRLRPKHEGTAEISGLRLSYYAPGRGYQKALLGEPLSITVKPAAPAAVPDHLPVLAAPPSFYELETAPGVLDRAEPTRPASPWLLAAFLLAPPVLAVALVRLWHVAYPDAAARARRRRSEAARRALRALHDAQAGPSWRPVERYLAERFGVATAELTPAEARQRLRGAGVSKPAAGDVMAFLQACDAARFAGDAAERDTPRLRDEAIHLVRRLEGESCGT